MTMAYVIEIDQSTQGTKVLLFDENGNIIYRADRPHRQIINDRGWVSHDMEEVYANLIDGVREVLEQTGVNDKEIAAVGISNQRETTVAWGKDGKPLAPAVVWQCGRAKGIVEELERKDPGLEEKTRQITGLPLSPYFPAAKMAWLLRKEAAVQTMAVSGRRVKCHLQQKKIRKIRRRERLFIWERWTAILSTV